MRIDGAELMYRRFTVLAVLIGALSPAVELRAQPPTDTPDPDAVAQNSADLAPSPLLSEPKSPEALFDAIVLMLDLDRPGLALRYMQQLRRNVKSPSFNFATPARSQSPGC